MPLLPHRTEAIGGGTLVHFVYDTPIALRLLDSNIYVYSNPFPPEDPRWPLTEELLDLLDGGTPADRKRRYEWDPQWLDQYLATLEKVAERRRRFEIEVMPHLSLCKRAKKRRSAR